MPTVKFEPIELLQLMRVPQQEGVYVLGCFERRVTMYSQQVRAINLAYSLNAAGELNHDATVAVIGAGAAALTFAVALLEWMPAASVVILEKHDEVMPIQRTCTHRSLHPHLYDWPAEGSLDPDANLPFLTWSADTAKNVVKQIETSWDQVAVKHGPRVQVLCKSADIRIVFRDGRGGGTVSWTGDKGHVTQGFDVIVLAVGYGLETSAPPAQTSYWSGDDLDSPVNPAKKWLVSGCGDGGLADVLRLSVRDAAELSTLAWLVGDVTTHPHCQKLLQAESYSDAAKRNSHYSEVCEPVAGKLHARLRDKQVTLNGPTQYPFGSFASILNRFLVSQLNQLKAVRYRPGEVRDWERIAGGISVHFDDQHVENFDRIVKRFGPIPALKTDFAQIWERFEPQRKMFETTPAVLDRSRIPMWPVVTSPSMRAPSKQRPLAEARPAGAPPPATSQPVDDVSDDEMIVADVFGCVTIPPEAKPVRIELEISALNTTRRNLALSRAYGLKLKTADSLEANDAYGPLQIDFADEEVLVTFKDRPAVPAGASYRWRLSVETKGSFASDRDVISGVYVIRPQHHFQDVKVRLHTFWYDFVFLKPKGDFHWLREYRVIQSNNRGLRCHVENERQGTRCSFNQFQLGADDDMKIHFTCLYQPPPLLLRWL